MVEDKIQQAVREEVIDIYSRVLTIIISKTTPILGEAAVTTILESAREKAAKKFEFLRDIELPHGTISAEKLKQQQQQQQLSGLSKDTIRDGFEEFIARFFDVLRALTGDILISKLKPEIEKLRGG